MHTLAPTPSTLDCVSRLIAFDTVSRNSNLDCIEWARGLLQDAGAACRLDWNGDRTKANMLASFGEGPGGLLFSGHVDVVSVEGQDWSSDPFRADIRDGKLYGRGACDMKGFVGCVLGHADACAASSTPVHIALTYDEEVGCLGIPHLVAAMQGWGVKPAGAIIGEPTSMRLVSAHKGGRVYRGHVTGRAAHSSLTHTAANAIEYAALLIARIHAIGAREYAHGHRADGFDVPFTTISTNLITGGNGPNIVPASTTFQFDYRYVPSAAPGAIIAELEAYAAELRPMMKARAPEADIRFELVNAIPALNAAPTDWIFGLVHAALRDKAVEKVGYGTEASFFEAMGVPSIVCGPGSIEQAHKADEYVTLEQLAACDRMIETVLAAA